MVDSRVNEESALVEAGNVNPRARMEMEVNQLDEDGPTTP